MVGKRDEEQSKLRYSRDIYYLIDRVGRQINYSLRVLPNVIDITYVLYHTPFLRQGIVQDQYKTAIRIPWGNQGTRVAGNLTYLGIQNRY